MSLNKVYRIPFFLLLFFLSGFRSAVTLQKISLSMQSKTLHKGKVITTEAEVFYKAQGGLLVTHFTKPFENIAISNARGEMKIYDPKDNSIIQLQSPNFSSQNSIFFAFFTNQTQDMGLKKMGYSLNKTQMEGSYMVSTWLLNTTGGSPIKKVELVLDKYSPIHMAFFDAKNEIRQKIYYSSYLQIEEFRLPMKITEISFESKADSTIDCKIYSNVKINNEVSDTYLDYKIPSSAKVVNPYAQKKK